MSEELREWADNVSREIRHYLTDHRHPDITAGASVLRRVDVLTAKVKEFAGALEVYADPNGWEIAYDVDTGDIADDRHVFVTDESEPWGVAKSALRAPRDDGRELVYIDYCSCVIPQATHSVPNRCYACGREIKPGGGEI